jgi:hypothetical protein
MRVATFLADLKWGRQSAMARKAGQEMPGCDSIDRLRGFRGGDHNGGFFAKGVEVAGH